MPSQSVLSCSVILYAQVGRLRPRGGMLRRQDMKGRLEASHSMPESRTVPSTPSITRKASDHGREVKN
jgi:hypothetical protein